MDRPDAEIFFTHEFFRALVSSPGADDVARLIVQGVIGALGAEIAAVYLVQARAGSLRLLAGEGGTAAVFAREVPAGTTLLGRAASDGAALETVVDPMSDSACWLADPDSIASQAAVALRSREGVVGVLAVASSRPQAMTEKALARLGAMADQASLGLQNALLREELTRRSVTDAVTDLHNRVYFQSRLEQELARARRFGHRVSLVMLDLDDVASPPEGGADQDAGYPVLRGVSSIIKATLRRMDVAARYGPEQFVVILPETSVTGALAYAERIRAGVAAARFAGLPGERAVSRTISVGAAVFPADGDTDTGLVAAAAQALDSAKRAGKDTVRTLEDTAGPLTRPEARPSDSGSLNSPHGTPIVRVRGDREPEGGHDRGTLTGDEHDR